MVEISLGSLVLACKGGMALRIAIPLFKRGAKAVGKRALKDLSTSNRSRTQEKTRSTK